MSSAQPDGQTNPIAALNPHVQSVLKNLHQHQYPTVASPPGLSRRASVAVVLRFNPIYPHEFPASSEPQSSSTSVPHQIDALFAQPWVQNSSVEVLFIKRSSRQGDRWNGHVALPGGRRDPEDTDDLAAAIRETREEVGIDLLADGAAIAVGNLPQRIVTTSWGRVPLMVLCPYIFVLLRPQPLRLQPTEVASAHWVPLAALQSPELRAREYQDVSNRLAKQERGLKRWFYRALLGQMEYAAIRLAPAESTFCASIPGFIPKEGDFDAAMRPAPPLHLWGLTLTVLADLLDLLPPHNVLDLWAFPTFTPPDVRFVIWLATAGFRRRMKEGIEGGYLKPLAVELGSGEVPNLTGVELSKPEAGIDGLGVRARYGDSASVIGRLLEEYYPLLRRGIYIALGLRLVGASAAAFALVRRYRR